MAAFVTSSLIYAYHCIVTKRVSKYTGLIVAAYFLVAGCATITTPSGGDKDVVAPKIVGRSVGDSTLECKGGKWTIDFDEFIKLQDVHKELNITPLVKNNPMVSVHKRKLSIHIPDSLLEANTTYRIDLGNAVRDLREGNPYAGLSWTFSTGTYFDSLRIDGECLDAATGLADTTVRIFLYSAETPDSLLWINKPLYITKNTAKGFEWRNLPNRDFKVVALQDDNQNFRRDAPSERIAFLTNSINPMRDTARIRMYSFSEVLADASKSKLGNTARFESKKTTPFNYNVNVDTSNLNQRSFNLYDTLKITFTRKPGLLNLTAVRLYADSLVEAEARVLPTVDSLVYRIEFDWQENTSYQLRFLPDFASDTNKQALTARSYRFRTKQASDYGLIRLRYTPNKNHRIQLISNNKVVATQSGNDSSIVFPHLLPGQYAIRRYFDENNNGQWDTGSWQERRQPERIEPLNDNILIKGNWENAIDMRNPNR
jgi:hypothetical protein